MCETSRNELVRLLPMSTMDFFFDDGTPLYYTMDGRAGPQFKIKKIADEFAHYARWYYANHPGSLDRSIKDFLQEFLSDHPLLTPSERMLAPQVMREVELWIGTTIEEASSKHLGYALVERNVYMRGGFDKLVHWIAEPLLAKTISFGHLVEEIHWDQDSKSVRVKAVSDNTSKNFTADAVIVTVPLGVLHRKLISFDPPLPHDIQAGISFLSYAALGKVFIEFSEVFWPRDNDQFVYYPCSVTNPAALATRNSILSYPTVTSNLWIMSRINGLCIQISEPLTQMVETMSSPETVFAFFEPLFKLLRSEPDRDLPPYYDIETTHWSQDSLSGYGTYSVEKTGDDPNKLIAALENHAGSKLQFAGEHCAVSKGFVHSAFESGTAAASNLLTVLNIQDHS
jgi:polyamine oxidase